MNTNTKLIKAREKVDRRYAIIAKLRVFLYLVFAHVVFGFLYLLAHGTYIMEGSYIGYVVTSIIYLGFLSFMFLSFGVPRINQWIEAPLTELGEEY